MTKYTHFKFDFECAAYEGIKHEHPVKHVDAMGVKYEHRTPHSMGNFWLFWNATNIPDPLPKCCSIVHNDPMDNIGYGLSLEDAKRLSK